LQELILLGIFGLAGATTYQFFQGRRKNLELMREYVRELENSLKPKDKTYTLLGLYSGFKAKLLIDDELVKEVEASVGLMPRESLLYYPISFFTLKHDRFYLVFKLNRKPKYAGHIVKKKVLSYSKANFNEFKVKEVSLHGHKYLSDCDQTCFETLKEVIVSPNVLHVALTPKTKVFYIFMKPRLGLPSRVIQRAVRVLPKLV